MPFDFAFVNAVLSYATEIVFAALSTKPNGALLAAENDIPGLATSYDCRGIRSIADEPPVRTR